MRMVVTGREGQVVRSLRERAARSELEIVSLGRPELDLAGRGDEIIREIKATRANVIVSAAAYTQVDKAENEADLAFKVNASGPQALAQAALELGAPLIHLSTDYVFDGGKPSPYVEEDPTGPEGVYGASKLEGERAVLSTQPDSAVLRTAWVYSPFGSNFVKTMLRLAREREEIRVVADQFGNPTSALDIANGIIRVATNLIRSDEASLRGIFHMTSNGEASWAEFAEFALECSAELGGPTATIRHISTADYPTRAKRPANSRLSSSKLARVHAVRLPDWRQSVKHVVARLLQDGTWGFDS